MFKNPHVQMLSDLRKKGVYVFLTDDGYMEYIKLLHHEPFPIENTDRVKAV